MADWVWRGVLRMICAAAAEGAPAIVARPDRLDKRWWGIKGAQVRLLQAQPFG